MRHKTTPWRHFTSQCRLAFAERLIGLASRIAPKGHPDSIAIHGAALLVASRKPVEVDWRDKTEDTHAAG